MNNKYLLLGVGTLVTVAAFFVFRMPHSVGVHHVPATDDALVAIRMPEISGELKTGQRLFNENCSSCHGNDGVGRNGSGPPLIHKIYESGHHGDESFQRAVAGGVRSHH